MCVSNGDLKVVSPVGWLVCRSRGELGRSIRPGIGRPGTPAWRKEREKS